MRGGQSLRMSGGQNLQNMVADKTNTVWDIRLRIHRSIYLIDFYLATQARLDTSSRCKVRGGQSLQHMVADISNTVWDIGLRITQFDLSLWIAWVPK